MKSIKNPLRIIGYLFLLTFLFTLGSCDMFINWFGTSIEGRVDAFNDDLSAGNYSSLYTHFHSDTELRTSMKNDALKFWDGTIIGPANAPCKIVSYSAGDTVTGTIRNKYDDFYFSMDMKKDGMEYFIRTLTIGSSTEIRKLD
ncbi:MAG: hypothetical protein K9M94_06165 [Spirochaetia bacterium]|nr:hypothetical protein [Spirochaetia bacterium]